MLQAVYKVPGGKLLKIFLETDGNILSDVKITGDFFLYPEEKISGLENVLKGQKLEEAHLLSLLRQYIENESIEFFGVDTESIVKTIFMAVDVNT